MLGLGPGPERPAQRRRRGTPQGSVKGFLKGFLKGFYIIATQSSGFLLGDLV